MAEDSAPALNAALGSLVRLAAKARADTQSFEQIANVKKQRFEQIEEMLAARLNAYSRLPFVPMGEQQPGQDSYWGPVTDMQVDERVQAWYSDSLAVAKAMNQAKLSGGRLWVWAGVGAQIFGMAPPSMREVRAWAVAFGHEARVQMDSLNDILAEDASLAAIAVAEMAQWIHRDGRMATNWHRYVAIYRQGVVDGVGRAPESLGALELHLKDIVTSVAEVKKLASGWGDDLGDAASR